MSTELQQVLSSLTDIKTDITELKTDVNCLKADVGSLKTDVENSNTKFDSYQKATQWIVNLAFSLIASATVIVVAFKVCFS